MLLRLKEPNARRTGNTQDAPLLIVGHSHVECLRAAQRAGGGGGAHIVNLRPLMGEGPEGETLVDRLKATLDGHVPKALCLCLGGNHHNVVGLLEDPHPFAIGASTGCVPANPSRTMIPRAVMVAYFKRFAHAPLMKAVFDAFPKAKRIVLNAPPPVGDFDHIRAHPGVLRDKLHLGPAPDELRLELYGLQTEVARDLAAAYGAHFVVPPSKVLTQKGFLAPDYFNADPTHGNAAYGRVMLDHLRAVAA